MTAARFTLPPEEVLRAREKLVLDHFRDEVAQDWDAALSTFPHPHYELIAVVSLFIGFLSLVLITPVGEVGLCLFYLDQRVRKEGFDIEYMLLRTAPEPLPPPIIETT